MPKEAIDTALVDGKKVLDVWIDRMKDLVLDDFKAAMITAQAADDAVETLRGQLDTLINQRNAQNAALLELTTRSLSGIRGYFGPDLDDEHERVGRHTHQRAQEAHAQAQGIKLSCSRSTVTATAPLAIHWPGGFRFRPEPGHVRTLIQTVCSITGKDWR